ncbi:hypothetical protein [Nocardioides iriomotensis]|uniref:WD40 repeat domain-containing protein n=1 Tax=Nocardioides iriomotensis TaxID=715784 RepID=A0A4Q5IU82_9ACTN|nr:hypothetical protein [Nocardioides iriomotensis]RYU09372.1 hypothetical protein ETU37_20090 [Nocardioides iriomotensis]
MTERLSTLLREEATDLPIPVPDAHAILRRGRAVRRRRRAGTVVATVAATAVVVAGFAALGPKDSGTDRDDTAPVTEPRSADAGAFAAGSTVWPRGADRPSVEVDGQVKAVYYTSEGVVARVGNNPYSDDAGPSRYVAINGDEAPRDLGIDLGDRIPSTDATQPYLAYADDAPGPGDLWDVVVLDVRDGSEVARVTVDGRFGQGGWEAPPVSLSGDHVYVALDSSTADVDWRAGTVGDAPVLGAGAPSTVVGGRAVTYDSTSGVTVVDVQTGDKLMAVPAKRTPYILLSPDGSIAKVVYQDSPTSEESFVLHDLDTGAEQTVDGAAWDYGWTAAGDLLKVTAKEATVCPTFADGGCSAVPVDLGKGELRIAGMSYES